MFDWSLSCFGGGKFYIWSFVHLCLFYDLFETLNWFVKPEPVSMFELRTFPGVGHLVTIGETQSCREWKISRTSAMNSEHANTLKHKMQVTQTTNMCTQIKAHEHQKTALSFGNMFTHSANPFHYYIVSGKFLLEIQSRFETNVQKHRM